MEMEQLPAEPPERLETGQRQMGVPPGVAAIEPVGTGAVCAVAATAQWQHILAPDVGMLLIDRPPPVPVQAMRAALAAWPGRIGFDGPAEALLPALAPIPAALAADISDLAQRFQMLAGTPAIRLRCERILGDACRKWHIDYTDLRLVCTYAGPGTDWRDPASGTERRLGLQQPALFKGRLFGDGAPLIEHRSPPIAGTGLQRLVLVIDTPQGPPV